jgi:hypothetical protein
VFLFRYVRDFHFIAKLSIHRTLISALLANICLENVITTHTVPSVLLGSHHTVTSSTQSLVVIGVTTHLDKFPPISPLSHLIYTTLERTLFTKLSGENRRLLYHNTSYLCCFHSENKTSRISPKSVNRKNCTSRNSTISQYCI